MKICVFALLLMSSAEAAPLVVVHSFSGHTARAGREWATMLGAKLVVVDDAPSQTKPPPSLPALPPTTRIYLGFPIWNEEPSPVALRLMPRRLDGVTVVPFYTYLHYVDPQALAALKAALLARGATVMEPIGMLVPLSFSEQQIGCLARRTLLDHRQAWPWGAEPVPRADCKNGMCRVPAGMVWVGDTDGDCTKEAPRAERVAAFDIQIAEVTIGAYRGCKSCPPANRDGFSGELVSDAEPRLPQPGVSLDGARAYCASVGMRLPTEAEWIRAGRGDGIASYPWGPRLATGEPARGNFGEHDGYPHYSTAPADWPRDGYKGLSPGCAFPSGTSPFGVCDLAGNLAEWVEPGVLKGGSWLDGEPTALRLGSRAIVPPGIGGFYLSGFRCVRWIPRADGLGE